MTAGQGRYEARARLLLERYGPGDRGAISRGDAVLLNYMWDPAPVDRGSAERMVCGNVTFAIAMLVLFRHSGLLDAVVNETMVVLAGSLLASGLGVETDCLAPALHAALSRMVQGAEIEC